MKVAGRFAGVEGTLALLVAVTVLPTRAPAQVPERGWGTITGAVYDSLLQSPLIGATVSLLNSSRSAVTDGRGRFVLDSVPAGMQAVSFWRSDLDSIGLSSFVAKVKVDSGRSASVALAVPSYSTFWRAACGRAPSRASADSGLVFGTVTDAETGHRLAGAQVAFTWLAVEHERPRQWVIERPGRTLTTDSVGAYYLCGTPVEYLLAARARAGTFASGLIEVLVDIRGISRRDLAVSREAVPGPADSGAGRRGLATLIGTVRGERGGLLPGAYASLEDGAGRAEVDSMGRFVLRDLPSGTQMLMVRRIGYFSSRQPVDLRNRDTVRVDVAMAEATILDTLRVTASPDFSRIVEEIDERRLSGFGYLLGPEEIRRHSSVQSAFEGVPLLEVRGSPGNFTLAIRKVNSIWGVALCTPEIAIDGYPADAEQLSSLNPRDLFAIEIYPHVNAGLLQMPYVSMNENCGAILVWTRAAVR